MSAAPCVRRLGRVDYEPTWQAMLDFTAERTDETPDELWICEHPPVYTLGQAGKPEHLLEKILPGKLKALYAQSCLLNQGFVKDPSVSVDALLKQVGKELGDDVSVVSFVRYQLGA